MSYSTLWTKIKIFSPFISIWKLSLPTIPLVCDKNIPHILFLLTSLINFATSSTLILTEYSLVSIRIGGLLTLFKIISPIPDFPDVFSSSADEYSLFIKLYSLFSPFVPFIELILYLFKYDKKSSAIFSCNVEFLFDKSLICSKLLLSLFSVNDRYLVIYSWIFKIIVLYFVSITFEILSSEILFSGSFNLSKVVCKSSLKYLIISSCVLLLDFGITSFKIIDILSINILFCFSIVLLKLIIELFSLLLNISFIDFI